MTLAFEPGGVAIGHSVPVAGAITLDVVLRPTLLRSAFSVRPVPDDFCVASPCDTFIVPAGRTVC